MSQGAGILWPSDSVTVHLLTETVRGKTGERREGGEVTRLGVKQSTKSIKREL